MTSIDTSALGAAIDPDQTHSPFDDRASNGLPWAQLPLVPVWSGSNWRSKGRPMDKNQLYYGDNLDILRQMPDGFVDLVYLDPPFNSNADYNVLFANKEGDESHAQIEAFEDTWHWTHETEALYQEMLDGGVPLRVADAIEAMRGLLGASDALSYLVMMTPRLVELHRVMRNTATLYLHCDPTASHYLKVVLDRIFGPERFLSEIIWKRTSAHNRTTKYGPVHDVILMYAKSHEWTWSPQFTPYDQEYIDSYYRHVEEGTGRRYRLDNLTSNKPGNRELFRGEPPAGSRYWGYAIETLERFDDEGRIIYTKNGYPQYKRYLDEMPGRLLQDVWTDVNPLSSRAAERLGYPTQKPMALLERIIRASSDESDVVLDPFCGCGTTVDAAQQLDRRWVGIDITYIAVDLITKRLRDTHGDAVMEEFEVNGLPRDVPGAEALFARNPFDFERWAVSLVHGQPNDKQVGDKGKDGVIRFPITGEGSGKKTGKVIVSVKGGENLGPSMGRDLAGTVDAEKAAMGILITLHEPTRGMRDAVAKGGVYEMPGLAGVRYPKLQIITIRALLEEHKTPNIPGAYLPYVKAKRLVTEAGEQPELFE